MWGGGGGGGLPVLQQKELQHSISELCTASIVQLIANGIIFSLIYFFASGDVSFSPREIKSLVEAKASTASWLGQSNKIIDGGC